jgi:SWIM/SEC-C metal-binding protein
MSDKFFFKGRQDARVNHVKSGYSTNMSAKAGSKKFPLNLVVTSEKRKQEIEQQLLESDLFANITIDETVDAAENISELNILLNKTKTVVREATPGRNDPCVCGSGKKYKKCCG